MDKDVIKKVRQIDVRLRRKVNSRFYGGYQSRLKGQGMVFADVREYVPGDDVRSISWSLTARMDRPYVKTFEEDREAQVILAVDISSSMNFGAGGESKKSALDLVGAVFSFCAQKHKDRLGLLLFAGDIELYIPPAKGRRHSFRIIREICGFKPKSTGTDIKKALFFLHKVLKRQSHIFVFSDFLTGSFEEPMRRLAQKHEVLGLVFSDIFEREMPRLGLVDIEDMETGRQMTLDLSSPFCQKEFKSLMDGLIERRDREFARSGCSRILIDCQQDIYRPLMEFFQKRKKHL